MEIMQLEANIRVRRRRKGRGAVGGGRERQKGREGGAEGSASLVVLRKL